MIPSVLNEGVRGMQSAQREMQKAAQDIANANIPAQQPGQQQVDPRDAAIPPVNEAPETAREGNIAEPIIELRRQELMFTASAKVVSVADQTLGSLLDVES